MLYKDLLSLIGETPLVLLEKFSSKVGNNNIYAKIESFNLTGSIKDRASKYMIMDAIDSGRLKKGPFIIFNGNICEFVELEDRNEILVKSQAGIIVDYCCEIKGEEY